jgi:hypothetical protein
MTLTIWRSRQLRMLTLLTVRSGVLRLERLRRTQGNGCGGHSSSAYFATSASSTGPYSASSESNTPVSKRLRRRRSTSARIASFTCPESASSAASSSATRSSSSETVTFRFAVTAEENAVSVYQEFYSCPDDIRRIRHSAARNTIGASIPQLASLCGWPGSMHFLRGWHRFAIFFTRFFQCTGHEPADTYSRAASARARAPVTPASSETSAFTAFQRRARRCAGPGCAARSGRGR